MLSIQARELLAVRADSQDVPTHNREQVRLLMDGGKIDVDPLKIFVHTAVPCLYIHIWHIRYLSAGTWVDHTWSSVCTSSLIAMIFTACFKEILDLHHKDEQHVTTSSPSTHNRERRGWVQNATLPLLSPTSNLRAARPSNGRPIGKIDAQSLRYSSA